MNNTLSNNNIIVPLKDNNNIHTNANNHKTDTDDLPRLGRKKSSGLRKSVSFSNEVSVTKVESWKEYNKDMQEESEYFKLVKEIKELKEKQAQKAKKEDCCCKIY